MNDCELCLTTQHAQGVAMTDDKIPVFSRGPWLLEETGQRFTGNQLDAAAFAKYRAALAEGQERRNETIAMCEHLRAQVEALRAERDALVRLWPLFEKSTKDYVFTAERAGEVAADMNTLRTAVERAARAGGGNG